MESDAQRLQGAWWIVSLELEGQKYPAGGSKIVIHGDRFVSLNMGAEYEGTVSFDQSQSPRTFDLAFAKGPEAGNKALGIYELDGDTWRICLGLAGRTRPREFASKPGTGHALETLRRDRGGVDRLPAAAELAAAGELEGDWAMVSCMQDGHPMDPRVVKSAVRSFHGGATTLTIGGRPFTKSRYGACGEAKPKTIDYPDLGQIGIYEVVGDRLNTSVVTATEPRPRDFASTAGDARTVSVWRRKHGKGA